MAHALLSFAMKEAKSYYCLPTAIQALLAHSQTNRVQLLWLYLSQIMNCNYTLNSTDLAYLSELLAYLLLYRDAPFLAHLILALSQYSEKAHLDQTAALKIGLVLGRELGLARKEAHEDWDCFMSEVYQHIEVTRKQVKSIFYFLLASLARDTHLPRICRRVVLNL